MPATVVDSGVEKAAPDVVPRARVAIDGNQAVTSVAFRTNEVIAIYPITPASPMGELADEWAAKGQANLWGMVPTVIEMQSEGGASGAVHGSLQAGALTTSFTASQGLLLMIPNLYKIAGELTPFVLHVATRSVASHALSIFCDHSDVMACRQTGMAMLAANSVQEAHDFALIAQAASLRSRVPFIHFFDGFRTSHEVAKIEELGDDDLRALLDVDAIAAFRERALTPDRPVIRGTAQNPDVFFQAREAIEPFYQTCPEIVDQAMRRFGERVGRHYHLFDYYGHPEAERVMVIMGSGAETAEETVDWMVGKGEKVGLIKVRLYRPWAAEAFRQALPASVRSIAVMDRVKEAGSVGDPLYLDVVASLWQGNDLTEIGKHGFGDVLVAAGRYGLGSKEFDPACVKAVFDELAKDDPKRQFTVGIIDDVSHSSLEVDPSFDIEPSDRVRAVFFGLGADGTVGANKNSIKIIGEETDNEAQGYFVYDSKKSGASTISHLRFGKSPIHSTYLVKQASFVACHQFNLLDRLDVLALAAPGATLLLNAPYSAEAVWAHLPLEVQTAILDKGLELWSINADEVATEVGLGKRINTIMQVCFFAISGVLPRDEAIQRIKEAIEKTYGRRGREVVRRNYAAVDSALEHLHRIEPGAAGSTRHRPPIVSEQAPDFVQKVTAVMMAGKGDLLPVSAMPVDGTWPLGTSAWEKRAIAPSIPIWDPGICIQCNQCALVCPHAAIRTKVYDPGALAGRPQAFLSDTYKAGEFKGLAYTVQVAPEDCTGCQLCVEICPAKDRTNPRHKAIDMEPIGEHLQRERTNFEFFVQLPEADRTLIQRWDAKSSQVLQPLFEFSGACSGCGETPYIKLLTQLYGDRLLIANATGCSSIYGGNLPTTPYTTNAEGRGPAWSNSLFEDNAEFGLGMRLGVDSLADQAAALVRMLAPQLGDDLATGLLDGAADGSEAGLVAQRQRVRALREHLRSLSDDPAARKLDQLADYLVKKSVWLVGGDGWAYDIGYGGVDHVLSSGRDVNILVLDTEVYSNTGGQQSKATPMGAAAKFAAAGKELGKKDLGLEAMSYGTVYVAQIAFGGKINQTVQALKEADAFPGPSMVIAFSHCIAHGYDMAFGAAHQELAVETGFWPLYRYDPRRVEEGKPPLALDMRRPSRKLRDYMETETRFRMVEKIDRDRYKRLLEAAQQEVNRRYAVYEQLAGITIPLDEEKDVTPS